MTEIYKHLPVKPDTYNMLTDLMPNRGDTFDACIKKLIRESAELRDAKIKRSALLEANLMTEMNHEP